MNFVEIESQDELNLILQEKELIQYYAFQNLDFKLVKQDVDKITFRNCIFLGCDIPANLLVGLYNENYVFPQLNVPYNCYPNKLYTKDDLYTNYKVGETTSYKNTDDYKIYNHYIKTGKEASSINETLARRLHDHAITDAMYDFIADYDERKIVAIMGGHALSRSHDSYRNVALLAKALSEKGYLLVTGGGPGAMEATHLGVWFSNGSMKDLDTALEILKKAPDYQHPDWLDTAFQVIDQFPKSSKIESLGIPTWLYGHEPATPFATKIAKYFANSVREDGLLTIAKGGVIFSPGSAGTVQEIFQDATQNHYKSFGYASPMVFLGEKYWKEELPVFPFIEKCIELEKYKNLIVSITDDIEDVVDALKEFNID